MITPYSFFLKHAAHSWHPATETPIQGKRRGARVLASAESAAHAAGCSFDWSIDPDVTSADWCEDPDPWNTWQCVMRDPAGKICASVGGVDFGRDGKPWGDNYRRVIEAELAQE